MLKDNRLTPELTHYAKHIIGLAQDNGLSFYPIKFLLVSPEELNGIAAYGGFPNRIPHWTHGQQFDELHKKYRYGAAKIYELVINTDPVYAYLLTTNTLVDQKLVMAHVCGHADFFYNNSWFKPTDKNMLNQMANNASRVRRIIKKHGRLEVEEFINICKSVENLIDPYRAYSPILSKDDGEEFVPPKPVAKLPAKDYMDKYINTKDYLEAQKAKQKEEREQQKKLPERPDKDVLGFILEHSTNLERWKRDILGMIREESYYFAPQMMTKIMNEGWASFWHSELMTTKLADSSDIVDYCDRHSGVVSASGGLNPYRLGIELFRDIEDRWNRGAHGIEYDRCDDVRVKAEWDTGAGRGREKIFQVRQTCNDITFLDNYLTPEFCLKQKLFKFEPDNVFGGYTQIETEFKKVKSQLLTMLSNGGQPIISVSDGNYDNKGELMLSHDYDGRMLDTDQSKDVLKNLYELWGRPVHLQTVDKNTDILWSYTNEGFEKTLLL